MSDKPLPERLQVKNGRALAAVNTPAELKGALDVAEPGIPVERADVVLVFAHDRADLERRLTDVVPRLGAAAILWTAYPKLTSKLASDLSRDVIRNAAPAYGLDTVSQIAIDSDWSALRLKRF
jgi:hypothetical protein